MGGLGCFSINLIGVFGGGWDEKSGGFEIAFYKAKVPGRALGRLLEKGCLKRVVKG